MKSTERAGIRRSCRRPAKSRLARVRQLRLDERATGDDSGFTVIEAATAGFVIALAIAAGTASIIAATNARAASTERLLASEIANEVMLTAEAFGCGLPIGYNGVSAASRLARCDYDPADASEGAALADADFTLERGGFTFDVRVRMNWGLLEPIDSSYGSALLSQPCVRLLWWADNRSSGGPGRKLAPTVLTRAVEVVTERAGVVSLSASQAVDPDLARPHHSFELVSNSGAKPEVVLRQTAGSNTYDYVLHVETGDCGIFPYLEKRTGVDYQLRFETTSGTAITLPISSTAVWDDSGGFCWITTGVPRDLT